MKTIRTNFIPVVILGFIDLVLCLWTEWRIDSVTYGFFIPLTGEEWSAVPVENIGDIFISQYNHYINTNGRFVVHFLVQLFAGLLGKTAFAIFDSVIIMAVPVLLLKLAADKAPSKRAVVSAVLLSFLLLVCLPFDPAFHINYVWTLVFAGLWMYRFIGGSGSGKFLLTLYFVASVLIGECNESFSIPICVAVAVYALMKRMKLSRPQWCLAVGFGIGSIILVLSPANWIRLASTAENVSVTYMLENLIFSSSAFPLLLLYVILFGRKSEARSTDKALKVSAVVLIVVNYLIGAKVGFSSSPRMVIISGFVLSAIMLRILAGNSFRKWEIVLLGIVSVAVLAGYSKEIARQNRFERLVGDEYDMVSDGYVFVPDEEFVHFSYDLVNYPMPWVNKYRALNPDGPLIHIWPESLRGFDRDKDTSFVLPIGEQAWIAVQSRRENQKITVSKTLLPEILNKGIGYRTLDFRRKQNVTFDSTDNVYVGIYVNHRPYIRSEVNLSAE